MTSRKSKAYICDCEESDPCGLVRESLQIADALKKQRPVWLMIAKG